MFVGSCLCGVVVCCLLSVVDCAVFVFVGGVALLLVEYWLCWVAICCSLFVV